MENGHVAVSTFAAVHVAKQRQRSNDGHGCKIIAVPFDGRAMDKNLAKL
ncbi:MAG: hypothetical protein ABW128_17675 [Rhizorhabdus sp.]